MAKIFLPHQSILPFDLKLSIIFVLFPCSKDRALFNLIDLAFSAGLMARYALA